MGIERNHPVPYYDIGVCPVTTDDNRVVLVRHLEELFKELTKQCKQTSKNNVSY